MSRLGQYLQTRGFITGDQLDEAISHQAVQGARLGTNLVELGYIGIEELAQCLADFHKVPLPERSWLEKPQRAAAQRATRSIVERIRFIPLRLEGKLLHAAVLDPRNPSALDDLRFATGCRIQPYVLPEIWMHDWLLQLFKVPRGIRHVDTQAKRTQVSGEVNTEFAAHQALARSRANARGGRNEPLSMHEQLAEEVVDKGFSPGMPDAPPFFETTAMSNAAASSRAADSARPLARLPKMPGQNFVVTKLSDNAVQTSINPPAAARVGAPPAPFAAPAATPTASRRQPDPEPSRAQSVRPPPIVVRPLTAHSSIEDTFWAMAAPTITIDASNSEPPEPPTAALRNAPPAAATIPELPPQQHAQLAQLAPDSLPAGQSYRSPDVTALPELYPAAAPIPEGYLPAVLEPMAVARELSHWESALHQASDRERLIELAFSIANCFATRVAIFTVHQGMVQGLRYIERGVARPVDGVLVPVHAECMLSETATRVEPMRVDPRLRAIDDLVRKALGDEDASEVALFPVIIKARVVNVLYASNGSEPLGAIAFGALGVVAQEMSTAYQRLILSRKASAASG